MKPLSKLSSICLLGISSLLISQAILADNIPKNRKVTKIQTYPDWAVVRVEPAYANDLGCQAPPEVANTHVVIDWGGDPRKKVMYAAALGAYLTGKSVGFGIRNCWEYFGGGVPLAYRMDMEN